MTRPKDLGEGELDFTDQELGEMNVDLAGRDSETSGKRRKRSMLRVPADEVPHPQEVSALPTEPILEALPASPADLADELVEHAFGNGGFAEGNIQALLKFAAIPTPHDTDRHEVDDPVEGELEAADVEEEHEEAQEPDAPIGDAPSPAREVVSVGPPIPKLSPAMQALVRAVATPPMPVGDSPVKPPPTPTSATPPSATPSAAPSPTAATPTAAAATEGERPPQTELAAVELEDEELEEVEAPNRAPSAPPMAAATPPIGPSSERARSLTPLVVPPPPPAFPLAAQALAPPLGSNGPPRPPAVTALPASQASAGSAPALLTGPAPESPLRPRRRRRAKQWFEEIFDDDYLRTLPFLTPRQTEREAAFIAESMGVESGSSLLDLGCGYGRHAMELAGRGCKVTGLDLSLPLLIRAADAARRVGVNVNFVHGDMREMTFENEFDGAYSMFTSFGYFDDDTNRKVAANLARAVRPGGKLLLELVNRDYLARDLPTRVWWQGEGCVVLEEVDFNYFSSRLQVQRSIIFEDGRQLEQDISIRAYSLHEIGKVLHHSGFRVTEVSGGLGLRGKFFGTESRQLIVLAEKKDGP